VLPTSCNYRFLQLCSGLKHNQPLTVDGGWRSMFALVKPDLRACTRLLSVAAAARRSPLLLLAARRCCWIWMLMEPARTLILPLGACSALLPLPLLLCSTPRFRAAIPYAAPPSSPLASSSMLVLVAIFPFQAPPHCYP
jgi:hypothetical protein